MSQNLKSAKFPAGRLNFDPITKKVTPDLSKGQIFVFHNSDSEKHFQWINQTTNSPELDLYIFEGDAKFEKVQKSKNRVYLLSFQSNDDKFFFWLQDPDATKDEILCQSVNEVINFIEQEQNIEEEQEEPEEEEEKQATNPQQDLLAKIQATFSKLGGKTGDSAGVAERDTPCLNEILKGEYLNEVSQDKEFVEGLLPLLPEGKQDLEELKETLKSPMFFQALDSLDKAVNNENGASVLASLGLDPSFFYQNYDGSDSLYKGLNKLMKK